MIGRTALAIPAALEGRRLYARAAHHGEIGVDDGRVFRHGTQLAPVAATSPLGSAALRLLEHSFTVGAVVLFGGVLVVS